ncbi:L-lactate dehydrogenase [Anaerostipes sp. MSJ-23]|uniref:L-lactate dehydrogenase n=1 Tax=unclassified Anaerostipes TaxID=2635253 RepID=UPI001C0FCDE0|nr:L-lactate dehydrogenase [Anaerostipes sp. MSJ-23]MBU5458855.1 L-lactate dehydrogenase [Anaerostipes sp. MSJ-23]
MLNMRKAAIIGCGFVGSATAFSLMHQGLFTELVLIDVNHEKAKGEAMDLSHGRPYVDTAKIYAGSYDDISDCSMIIITAGANQKPEETRLDLVQKNVAILKTIIPEITKRGYDGILLIVSNPVDILTYAAYCLSGFEPGRVLGSGTVLDSARLRYLLSEHLKVDTESIHAFIIGEHGDSELAVWSSAHVAGIPIHDFCEFRGHFCHHDAMENIYQNVRESAYEIIHRKGATYYGIAMAVNHITESMIRDKNSVLPLSTLLTGQYGLQNLYMSVPTIVNQNGAGPVLELPLNEQEQSHLQQSAQTLKKVIQTLDIPQR